MRLKVLNTDGRGREFSLANGSTLLGRGCRHDRHAVIDLESEDPEEKISQRHALIESAHDRITIEDLGSLNGTFVNRGDRLKEGESCELKVGDTLIIGKTVLLVES